MLCAVDDAHWIDEESALALGFVARRVYADRVGIILAVDDTGEPAAFQRLPTIEVGGLPDDAAGISQARQGIAGNLPGSIGVTGHQLGISAVGVPARRGRNADP